MKILFTYLILISNFTVFSQSKTVVGDYKLVLGSSENDVFEYKMTLNQDGTFFLHYYSNIKKGIPPKVNKYGKGKWTEENKVISLFCDKQLDLDEKHTLNFSNSKARFIIKSPRDKTDRIIKTRIKFLESEIFWMKGIELFKI